MTIRDENHNQVLRKDWLVECINEHSKRNSILDSQKRISNSIVIKVPKINSPKFDSKEYQRTDFQMILRKRSSSNLIVKKNKHTIKRA